MKTSITERPVPSPYQHLTGRRVFGASIGRFSFSPDADPPPAPAKDHSSDIDKLTKDVERLTGALSSVQSALEAEKTAKAAAELAARKAEEEKKLTVQDVNSKVEDLTKRLLVESKKNALTPKLMDAGILDVDDAFSFVADWDAVDAAKADLFVKALQERKPHWFKTDEADASDPIASIFGDSTVKTAAPLTGAKGKEQVLDPDQQAVLEMFGVSPRQVKRG